MEALQYNYLITKLQDITRRMDFFHVLLLIIAVASLVEAIVSVFLALSK